MVLPFSQELKGRYYHKDDYDGIQISYALVNERFASKHWVRSQTLHTSRMWSGNLIRADSTVNGLNPVGPQMP